MSDIQPTPKRSFLTNIFISSDEPRLRAGWRLLLQTLLLVFIGTAFSLVAIVILPQALEGNTGFLLEKLIEILVVISSIYIARRFLDKRTFTSLGFQLNNKALRDVVAGIMITFVMMGLIYLAEASLGWLKFEAFAWQVDPISTVLGSVFTFFILFIFVGVEEELLSRGYHLQTLASGINMPWAVVISSAVFGLAHLGNPNATWVSAAGIFFAGVFLAYGYIRTGQLWLPIGLHIGWNFFEGVIFGFPVSGLDIYRLIRHQVNGPQVWTGGAFGPEAGLIVLPALIAGAVLIYFYSSKKDAEA